MPENVTVREDLQVIEVISSGEVTSEDFKMTLSSIVTLKEERGLSKVFVDGTDVSSYPSTFPVFDFGKQASQSLRGTWVAIAVAPEFHDQAVFFETVVHNRGGNVRVFDTSDAALAWLKE